MAKISSKMKFFISLVFVLIGSALMWPYLPAIDKATYFEFADQRSFFELPHTNDVLSNLLFLFAGLFGILNIKKNHYAFSKSENALGFALALASLLASFGSIYFHWNPNSETLFWDRLPMTIGFSAILAFVTSDRIDSKWGLILFVLLTPLAALSIIGLKFDWWSLKPYLCVQFGSLILIALLITAVPKKSILNTLYWQALCLYTLAKITEHFDKQIFEITYKIVSGHTLKHCLAAFSIFCVLRYFKTKTI